MHKISRFTIYLMLIASLALQVMVLDRIGIFGARPDLILILVIFFGLFLGPGIGFETGLVGGFLSDLVSSDIFWMNAFIFGVIGFLAGVLSRKVFKESKATQTIMVFSFTALAMIIRYLAASLFSARMHLGLWEYMAASVAPTSLYTSIISIPIFLKFVGIFSLKEDAELI